MKKKYRHFLYIIFSLLFIFNSTYSFSQSNKTEAAVYNIGIGSIFSGIGAIINKKPNEKLGKVLLKGLAQGALGGYIVYESKNLLAKVAEEERLELNWGAKVVNSAGISIIENASSNRNFWEQWNFHFGFNRLEFHTKDNFKIRYKILPAAFLLTAYSAIGNKFELDRTLRSGEFIFSSNEIVLNEEGLRRAGIAIGPSIIFDSQFLNNYNIITHEFVHSYQYNDFNFLNTYINKPLQEFEEGSKFFSRINKIFHYDIQAPFGAGLYLLEARKEGYYNNHFEREAEFYTNR